MNFFVYLAKIVQDLIFNRKNKDFSYFIVIKKKKLFIKGLETFCYFVIIIRYIIECIFVHYKL